MTTGDITLYYYLGDKMVALKKAGALRYVSQDHLTGTSVTSDTSGNLVASIKYMPFGATRAATGTIETEKKFTGQRLDAGVDLYYYGARYYDANIGRFISADTAALKYWNPQELNRYSYALNNPLRYIDPSGNQVEAPTITFDIGFGPIGVSTTVLSSTDKFTKSLVENTPGLKDALLAAVAGSSNSAELSAALGLPPAATGNLTKPTPTVENKPISAPSDSFITPEVNKGFRSNLGEFINENQMFIEFGMGIPGPTILKQTHHLIELRFAKRLGFKKIPTVELTPDEHQVFTNRWREEIGYSNSSKSLRTDIATLDDVWNTAQSVYRKYSDYLAEVRNFLFGK